MCGFCRRGRRHQIRTKTGSARLRLFVWLMMVGSSSFNDRLFAIYGNGYLDGERGSAEGICILLPFPSHIYYVLQMMWRVKDFYFSAQMTLNGKNRIICFIASVAEFYVEHFWLRWVSTCPSATRNLTPHPTQSYISKFICIPLASSHSTAVYQLCGVRSVFLYFWFCVPLQRKL